MLTTVLFWLRWSLRDLRDRWIQVTAVALVIALGTAIYAGLGSTTPWRLNAAEASYDLLNMYDLRVQFSAGTFVEEDRLLNTVHSFKHADWVARSEPRLITDTLVNVHAPEEDILVRGRLFGVSVEDGGPHINGLHVEPGRALHTSEVDPGAALLEFHFADYYDLPAEGIVTLRGGVTLPYIGHAMTPEYFMVTTEEGGVWAQASFAAVFVPLATAQRITAHPGRANDLLLTITDDADLERLEPELSAALAHTFPEAGFMIRRQEDESIKRLMFQSIHMNQQVYDLMIGLFLAGASFGAFNLASRIVEAQRRQIGIGMALGIPPRLLAVRPLLVGTQIAVMGAIFGLVLGLIIGKISEIWMRDLIPMPVMGQLFDPMTFLEAAALGFVLPFAATLYPVWRAVRVLPVDAIKTGHLIENHKGSGLAPMLAAAHTPGKSFTQMPLRNLLRSPRRTILTTLGIATAITTLIGLTGMLDSATLTLDRIRREIYQDHPHRLTVFLDSFYPQNAPQIDALQNADLLAHAEPAIRIPGTAIRGETNFKVLIEALSLDNALWTPTVIEGRYPRRSDIPELLVSKNAAADLGIGIGDTFTLEHPRRAGILSYQFAQTEVRVVGFHADQWRTFVYLDAPQTSLFGLDGMANIVEVNPQASLDERVAKNRLFDYDGVASVIAARETVESAEGVLREVIRFLSAVQAGVLALAFLIAFNSTNINMNERAREIATMFAFGLPPRTVTRMAMLENLLTGIAGTALGLVFGLGVLTWMLKHKMPGIMPELYFPITLSAQTIIIAIVIGVVVTTLTPILLMRRIMAMDISSTLRVME